MELATEMVALAERVAASAPDRLDFTFDSLDVLQAMIADRPITDETTRMWGAYVGETLRRAVPERAGWIDYAAAAAACPAIAELEYGPDISAILRIDDTFSFPLAKVEKLQRNGAEDSLAPYAAAALAMLDFRARETPARRIDRAVAQLRDAGEVELAPVTDEDLLEDASLCSPSYGDFLRRHGAGGLVRAGDGFRLVVHRTLDEIEVDAATVVLRVAALDGAEVYFLRDDLNDDDELQLVSIEDGELIDEGTFEAWLARTLTAIG